MTMLLHWKWRRLIALCLETNRKFGAKPFAALQRLNGEIIIDLPYMRLIVTPGKQLRAEETTLKEQEKHVIANDIKTGNLTNRPLQQGKSKNSATAA